jgi:outer membrane protein, heavy metal efflux system
MRETIARACGACLTLLLTAAPLSAQADPGGDMGALSLAEALDRTAARSPLLIGAGYEVRAAEGRLLQARLRPNPELGVTVEDALGTGQHDGVDQAETTFTLGWILERGVRERLVDAAGEAVALQNVSARIALVDAAAETARRFADCLAFQARLEQAASAIRIAEETVTRIRERVAAGRAPGAELARAEAELARAELRKEDYEHELESAYRRLAAQWADTEPDFSVVGGDVRRLPEPGAFEALLARVDENPDIVRYVSQRRLDESQLRLAEARRRPSWQVYAGMRRFEATDDVALVGGVTLPLPLSNRNEGRIAEARANVARTEADAAAARLRVETELFVLHQALLHDVQLARRLDDDVVPLMERALAETRGAYEAGRYGYLELRAAQAELLDATSDRLEAAIDAHRIIIEIERLTGTAFVSPVRPQGGRQ